MLAFVFITATHTLRAYDVHECRKKTSSVAVYMYLSNYKKVYYRRSDENWHT